MTRVVVLGNCQAGPAAAMLREAEPDWIVDYWTVYLEETWGRIDKVRDSINAADVIITQPISDGFAGVDCLSTSWIRENKNSHTDLVVFPVLYFRGQHPGTFNLRHGNGEITAGGVAYQDVLAVKTYLDTGSVEEAHRRAMAGPSLSTIERTAEASLAELRRRERDDCVTFPSSGYVTERWRDVGLFHCFNHPARALMAHQINAILAGLGRTRRVTDDGYDHLGYPHFAPAPALGTLRWAIEAPEIYRIPAGTMSREEFYRMYLRDIAEEDPDALRYALESGEGIAEFLQQLEE